MGNVLDNVGIAAQCSSLRIQTPVRFGMLAVSWACPALVAPVARVALVALVALVVLVVLVACTEGSESLEPRTPAAEHALTPHVVPAALETPVAAPPLEPVATLSEIVVYGAANLIGEAASAARRTEVRVVLMLDRTAVYRRGELPAEGRTPRSLFLDLDGAALSPRVPPLIAVAEGGLDKVRVTTPEPGRARILFDVGPETVHRLFALRDPDRIVMDFRDQSRAELARPDVRYCIVLDPGHGGDQPGAKGPGGIRESDVALALARRVRRTLERELPGVRVVMTRDADQFVTLEARAAIANALEADLFVSIHLNASPSAQDKGGVATYVLDGTDDAAAIRLAAAENGTGAEAVTELQRVLASLYRHDQLHHSLALAERVQTSTLRSGRRVHAALGDRGVKRSLFYVLVGARMPAVLVEASFITRPEEAALLSTDRYRQALGEGIGDGIARYVRQAQAARSHAK